MTRSAGRSKYIGQGDFVYRSGDDVPVFRSGSGAMLYDTAGDSYIDMEAANGTLALGYDSSILQEACAKTAQLPALPSFLESELRLQVAEKISRLVEAETGLKGRVAFDIGGAQGIELAIKIAHEATGRDAIAVLDGAYHGRSIYTSCLSASQRYRDVGPSLAVHASRFPCPTSASQFRGAGSYGEYFEEQLGDDRFGHSSPRGLNFAAFLFEPILNVGGMIEPDPEYIAAAVAGFRARGALIIADEIFTGFYRTGPLAAVQRQNISPDIIVFSKALTNGMAPLSCVWARDDLLSRRVFQPGSHSVTFGNTMMSLAVADVVLDRFQAWETRKADAERVNQSLRDLTVRLGELPQVARADTIGAIARIELRSPAASSVRSAAMSGDKGRSRVIVASTGSSPTTINLHPPLNVDCASIADTGETLAWAIAAGCGPS